MESPITVIDKIRMFRERSAHWRKVHFHCARYYQRCDFVLGMLSVLLATFILGVACYTVSRPDVPLWVQYSLAALTVLLGMLNAVQLYHRPAGLTENHRDTAASFGEMHRKWELLEIKYLIDPNMVTDQEIKQILEMGDTIARKARPVPAHIFREYNLPT
jgi:hypothetical protein